MNCSKRVNIPWVGIIKRMNIFQNSYFDNSFLYPTQAFLMLALLYILLIATTITIMVICIKKREKILSSISNDPIFSLLTVAMVILGSRIVIMFFNSSHVQILPELVFVMDMVGRDWLDGVMKPVMMLWRGLPFNPQIGYGQGFTVFIGLLLYPLYKLRVCTQETLVHFSQISYIYLASLVSLTYVVLIVTKYKSQIRNSLLIVFITFLLGYSGSLGLERGNTDIIFSLIILLLYFFRMRTQGSSKFFYFIEVGLLGMLTASKMTLLPISLAFILTSDRLLPSIVYFFFSYGIWSFSPALFGIKSSLLDSYNASIIFLEPIYFSKMLSVSCWAGNHVLRGIASIFILCSQSALEEFNKIFTIVVNLIFYILAGTVFILPLIPLLSHLRDKTGSFISFMRYVYGNRSKFLLLLLVLAVAAINLLPVLSFSYRLYYSFAVLLAAWYSIQNVQARKLLLVSTVCFLLKGFWFTDLKILNVFIALHYMTLIYASSMELRLSLVGRKDFYGSKKK